MFPQTYGTRYYGKRFPIKTEKQITAESKGSVFIKYTKVIMLYLIAITRGATTFLPKQIGKKIIGQAKGITTIVKKAVSFSFSIVCKVGTKITKHMTISIKAICRGIATIKKQMQKILATVTTGLGYMQAKSISKRVGIETTGAVKVAKHITLIPVFVACKAGANIVKRIILIPIIVASKVVITVKRHIQKILLAIAVSLASIKRHRVFEFEFIGSFAPGDVVKINSKTLEATLNDENALHLIKKADFPVIHKGEQKLIYKDKEGNRTVKITVKWRDKWL